jgi:Nif-specific regulatory protein
MGYDIGYMLVAIEGPLKGSSFPLGDDPCTVGRDPCNTIQLADPAVSRQHCTIKHDSTHAFLLTDSDSRNGTFRNGLPVTTCELLDGDEIKVGASRFLFLSSQSQAHSAGLTIGDQEIDPRTLVIIQPEEVIYTCAGEQQSDRENHNALSRTVALLLRLSSTVQVSAGLESLAESVLGALMDYVPARQGTVVLFERDGEEPSWAFSFPLEPVRKGVIPRAVLHKIMRDRVAAFYNAGDAAGAVQNVLAAPLFGRNRILGALCLMADSRLIFDKSQLQLVTALGGFLGKSFEEAIQFVRLAVENHRLQREIDLDHGMIGESAASREIYRFLSKVAPTDATVLICGESGTGKELVARALHRNSNRVREPFIAINCAALTETLIESELFGHEKGAFTGAFTHKRGKFEVADKGTVFLDEVGELPLPLQAKLLRVLQEREFERVGGTRPIRVDVRLIAATNRDLKDAVAKGNFRKDLYYRLNVVTLTTPPLRERAKDILLLAEHFLHKTSLQVKRPVRGISKQASAILTSYKWPGNVRELENAIERAVVIGSDDLIMPADLPQEILDTAVEPQESIGGFHDSILIAKRRVILDSILRAKGNYTEAAKSLGLNPTYLHRLIDNLHLKADIMRLLADLEKPASRRGIGNSAE